MLVETRAVRAADGDCHGGFPHECLQHHPLADERNAREEYGARFNAKAFSPRSGFVPLCIQRDAETVSSLNPATWPARVNAA